VLNIVLEVLHDNIPAVFLDGAGEHRIRCSVYTDGNSGVHAYADGRCIGPAHSDNGNWYVVAPDYSFKREETRPDIKADEIALPIKNGIVAETMPRKFTTYRVEGDILILGGDGHDSVIPRACKGKRVRIKRKHGVYLMRCV